MLKWKNELEGIVAFRLVLARDAACKNEVRLLKDLTGTEATITNLNAGTYYACLFADTQQGESFAAENNGYKIVLSSGVPTPGTTITATQFILKNPADSVAGISTIVNIEARDANHNIDVDFSTDVTLVCDGSATGCGIINIENGIGTAQVNTLTPGIVNLSLIDHLNSGLDVSSTQDVFFVPAAPSSINAASGIESTNITWSAVTGAESYTIFWDDEAGVTSSDSAITNATSSYNHLSLTPGTTYYYRVAALKDGIIGALSNEVSAFAAFDTVEDPTISLSAGTYKFSQRITLSTNTAGATIRYTLDGSDPSSTVGTIYTEAITVSTSSTLKAIATKTNWLNSNISTASYNMPAMCTNCFIETQRIPSSADIEAVHAFDANNIWVAGYGGTVAKTSDGGGSWTILNPGTTVRFNEIDMLDANTGWLVGDANTILKTTDGGATWTAQISAIANPGVNLFGVHFVNANTGWIVGTSGTIMNTTDGGMTWTQQTSPGLYNYQTVFFLDENVGWATGGSGRIVKTIDGGLNWANQTSGITQEIDFVQFVDANTGYATANEGKILKTVNGGTNWIEQTSGTANNFLTGAVIDANTAWAMGVAGEIFKTTDGGNNWVSQTYHTVTIQAAAAIDSNHVLTVGSNGLLEKSSDGGANWADFGLGSRIAIHEVKPMSPEVVWAIGGSGQAYRTANGGDSWSIITNLGFTSTMYSVFAFDEDHAIVAGNGGRLRVTQDTAANWTNVTPTATRLSSVHFADANTGWVVGYSGEVYKSVDAGLNWTAQSSGVAANLFDVFPISSTHVWACGAGGVILATVDGGDNWLEQTSGTIQDLKGVHFINTNVGWAVGNNGTLLKTTNGGTSWNPLTSGTSNNLNATLFFNANEGWVVGETGLVMKTANGGLDWTVVNSLSDNTFYNIYGSDIYNLWVSGSGGALRKYNFP